MIAKELLPNTTITEEMYKNAFDHISDEEKIKLGLETCSLAQQLDEVSLLFVVCCCLRLLNMIINVIL